MNCYCPPSCPSLAANTAEHRSLPLTRPTPHAEKKSKRCTAPCRGLAGAGFTAAVTIAEHSTHRVARVLALLDRKRRAARPRDGVDVLALPPDDERHVLPQHGESLNNNTKATRAHARFIAPGEKQDPKPSAVRFCTGRRERSGITTARERCATSLQAVSNEPQRTHLRDDVPLVTHGSSRNQAVRREIDE
jgi:hypothetical protein